MRWLALNAEQQYSILSCILVGVHAVLTAGGSCQQQCQDGGKPWRRRCCGACRSVLLFRTFSDVLPYRTYTHIPHYPHTGDAARAPVAQLLLGGGS